MLRAHWVAFSIMATTNAGNATYAVAAAARPKGYYRHDGVRITHDPFAPGMASKYGRPGATDPDGFDPYADTVGAGIYSGNVVRDEKGNVVIGQQYQNHNPRPGPMYDGTGYTAMSRAIGKGPAEVTQLLRQNPSLVSEISTGGATPLHTCGMSRQGQMSTAVLIKAGADVDALDSYGYTPLQRMASNNLAVGAQALIDAGAQLDLCTGGGSRGETALSIALASHAMHVVQVLEKAGASRQCS